MLSHAGTCQPEPTVGGPNERNHGAYAASVIFVRTSVYPAGRDGAAGRAPDWGLAAGADDWRRGGKRVRYSHGSALMALRYTKEVVPGDAAAVISTCCSSSSSQFMGFAAAQIFFAFDPVEGREWARG